VKKARCCAALSPRAEISLQWRLDLKVSAGMQLT
jgi:hypothetical protein